MLATKSLYRFWLTPKNAKPSLPNTPHFSVAPYESVGAQYQQIR